MLYTTFIHTVGETDAKISIHDAFIGGERYYYACVINIADDTYKKLSEAEKTIFYGIKITDINQDTVLYRDPENLKGDILKKYGKEVDDPFLTERIEPDFLS